MKTQHWVILCTCPKTAAESLAMTLIQKKLAACVNILPGVQSIYEWEGDIKKGEESLLIIKTHEDRYAALEQHLQESHPYECPEIIALPIQKGNGSYLNWIEEAVGVSI